MAPECCASFWQTRGYGDPNVVGRSSWVHKHVLLLYRIISSIVSFVVYVYPILNGKFSMKFLTIWTLLGSAITYALAAIACVLMYRSLAKLVTASYHVFFTASILVTPVYWMFEFPRGGAVSILRVYPHGVTAGLFLLDLALCGQMEYRFFDIIWVFIYGVIYLTFMFARFFLTKDIPYRFLDHRKVGTVKAVISYIVVVSTGMLFAIVIMVLSRFTRVYRKRTKSKLSGLDIGM